MQTVREASHSPSILSPQKSVYTRRSPSYLYQKGTIYYFRYAFSTQERQYIQRAEIRISLRTGFVNEAKKLARQLRARLEDIIMSDQTEMSFAEVKAALHKQLKELMDMCPEKNPPSLPKYGRGWMAFAREYLMMQIPLSIDQSAEYSSKMVNLCKFLRLNT